jgi:hypothetical protein
MSLESGRAFLQVNAPDIELIETDDSSSTVELAAKVHGALMTSPASPRRRVNDPWN